MSKNIFSLYNMRQISRKRISEIYKKLKPYGRKMA